MNKHTPQNQEGRLIIVEDDSDLRDSLVKYLNLSGFDVTGVGSALEFYKNVSANTYTIAIVDLGLPDQNGLVLTEYLRKNTDIRIILLTSSSSMDDKLSGYHCGADFYFVKPVDLRELSAIVTSLFARIHHQKSTTPNDGFNNKTDWIFIRKNWLLQTPCGKDIKLTAKELNFISFLISDTKEVSTRQELLKRLEYLNNESGHRSLESLVNRLRSKILTVCGESPIKTVHGTGYSLLVNVVPA